MNIINSKGLSDYFKSICQSEKVQLDNLDYAKLVFNEEGEVIVENEHGTQFPIYGLSNSEIMAFYENI